MGGGIFLTARGKSACLSTALYYRADKYILYIISGAPNENIVQNHINIALLNVL